MDTDLTDALAPGTAAATGRRRLLGAGLTGAALSLLPFAARRAAAQDGEATTTTAPPKRPTEGDVELLAAAQSFELAALELYTAATAVGGLDEAQTLVLETVLEAHRAFANSWSSFLGRSAGDLADSGVVSAHRSAFRADSAATRLEAAATLEASLVATYRDLLGRLEGTDAAKLAASILVAEARHGTVLADVTGGATLEQLLVDQEAAPLEAQG